MASNEENVSQGRCSSLSQKCNEKDVTSFSETMVSFSETLESTEILSVNAFSSKSPSVSYEELHPSKSLMKIKDKTDDVMNDSKQCISKTIHSSSSSSSPGQSFGNADKPTHHGYGHPSSKDSKPYQISGHLPTPYQTRSTNIQLGPRTSPEFARGPRASRMHFPSSTQKNEVGPLIYRDQFNRSDFQIKYQHAKFFMIKSFSEDDIHKSIKYSVWASTSLGNGKLEAAFRDAQQAADSVSFKCPVFLFFSVNASGQFVGLAEMIGPIDFNKTMEFWEIGRWNGFFPVKWHIIKDIPNKYFYNITLENNENKSVTFSRDTQEIGLPQGLKMLQYFKNYPLARSLLDDFDFYEKKEKSMNDQRRHAEMNRNFNTFSEHLEAEFDQMSI